MAEAITNAAEAQQALARLFETHEHAVFFGGAGVSTASGIPDFRSVDGRCSRTHSLCPINRTSTIFIARR